MEIEKMNKQVISVRRYGKELEKITRKIQSRMCGDARKGETRYRWDTCGYAGEVAHVSDTESGYVIDLDCPHNRQVRRALAV
jgi:hypothetical protein